MQHIIPHYALKRIIRKIENAHRAKWRLHYSAAWKIDENFKILFFFFIELQFFFYHILPILSYQKISVHIRFILIFRQLIKLI